MAKKKKKLKKLGPTFWRRVRQIGEETPDGTERGWVHAMMLAWQRHYLATHPEEMARRLRMFQQGAHHKKSTRQRCSDVA